MTDLNRSVREVGGYGFAEQGREVKSCCGKDFIDQALPPYRIKSLLNILTDQQDVTAPTPVGLNVVEKDIDSLDALNDANVQ